MQQRSLKQAQAELHYQQPKQDLNQQQQKKTLRENAQEYRVDTADVHCSVAKRQVLKQD
jgi:septal ring factor EnvC (AmiA/AmiB activator)